jgi:hypothetical protein
MTTHLCSYTRMLIKKGTPNREHTPLENMWGYLKLALAPEGTEHPLSDLMLDFFDK